MESIKKDVVPEEPKKAKTPIKNKITPVAPKVNQTKQINFRLTPAEYVKAQENANRLGLTVSAYAKKVALKTTVKSPKIAPKDAQKIASALVRYGSNINQIAYYLNGGSELAESMKSELEAIHKGLGQIWKQLDVK